MKIYFDESGQSGCIFKKDDLLNFKSQPTFAVGALVIKDDSDYKTVYKKYDNFKKKFNIRGEVKGSDLLTKEKNNELKYLLRYLFDNTHYYVLIYDKRFYIATLLLTSLFGFVYQSQLTTHYYQQATVLSKQKDDFFIQYLNFIENPSKNSLIKYLEFLINYEYVNFNLQENAVVEISKMILDDNQAEDFYKDFMTFGWYKDANIVNLINLNALSELIYFIKNDIGFNNENICYIHDSIDEFEDVFKDELSNCGIDVNFEESKNNYMLQIIDNITSIVRHAYDKSLKHSEDKKLWKESSEWDLKLLASVQHKLSVYHINYTVPLNDWAFVLCIAIMFGNNYPKKNRNTFVFNYHYYECLKLVYSSISDVNTNISDVFDVLNM
ncbi:MAG: hypothetical protein IJE53_03745 [Bacilli bacterium]|nr:hypothetical protein [Bacilli bacterium]